MRDIHFRGKTLEAGEWVYGSFVIREQDVHGTPGYFISSFGGHWIAVDPESVGQYVGRDIDDNCVYEGDLLAFLGRQPERYLVQWMESDGGFGIFYKDMNVFKLGMTRLMKVSTNIHDSPELLHGTT